MYYCAVIVVIKGMCFIKMVDGYISLMFPRYAAIFTFDVVIADTTYSISEIMAYSSVYQNILCVPQALKVQWILCIFMSCPCTQVMKVCCVVY